MPDVCIIDRFTSTKYAFSCLNQPETSSRAQCDAGLRLTVKSLEGKIECFSIRFTSDMMSQSLQDCILYSSLLCRSTANVICMVNLDHSPRMRCFGLIEEASVPRRDSVLQAQKDDSSTVLLCIIIFVDFG